MELIDADLDIIRLLQEDGRRPTTDIARTLGLPEATVRRRLERLIRDEVIRIVAIADGEKLGLAVHVLIGLEVDLNRSEAIGAALAQFDEVRWLGMTTGAQDFMLEAYFRSTAHFHDFLVRKLAKIPGIIRSRTSTVLSLEKNIYRWVELMAADVDERNGGGSPEEVTGGLPPSP
jgi:Lrp/AsnC family transcriptional regulator for asnA, asnC and gidA